MLQAKNGAANELRAKADALRADLVNPELSLSSNDVAEKVAAIKSWEQRAAVAAEFTPEKEIERQGGDEELKKVAPDADTPEMEQYRATYDKWSKDTLKVFGTVDNYVRCVAAAERHGALTPAQVRVIQAGKRISKHAFGEVDAEIRGAIVGTANDASGGEFLLPLQQDQSIFQVSMDQIGLLQRGRRYPVTGRSLRIPYVEQTDGTNTRPVNGIAAVTIVGEGSGKPEREPVFLQRTLTVYKWAAYSKMGDEVLADDMTGDLGATVTRLVGGQVMDEMNYKMTSTGSGSGEPLGALHANNTAILVVNRETSQSVTSNDVFKMWSRHMAGPGCYWSCSRRVVEKLFALTLGNNTLVTFLRDLNGQPQFNLLGYPVIVNDLQPTIGVKGDLALINPAFYAVAVRSQLTVESSIHVAFIEDVTTYRFFARGGGIPIPTSTYAFKASGGVKIDEISPFVLLGDDATS